MNGPASPMQERASLPSPADAMTLALEHYGAGRLRESEDICREVLEREPAHADALHLLGVLAHRNSRSAFAVELMSRAVKLDPSNAEIHFNLGVARQFVGRLTEAAESYREALRLQPSRPETHNNLGYTLLGQGLLDDALTSLDQALRLRPEFAEAIANKGEALLLRGAMAEAEECLRHALRLRPDFPEANNHLGVVLRSQGRLDEAEACFHQVLRVRPDFAGAHNNLGRVCEDRGRLDEAAARFRLAICYQPDDALIHTNLANVLVTQGKAVEALPFHQKAVQLQPAQAILHSNLSHTLTLLGQLDEAEACCREAIRLQPDLVDAHHNLAITLAAQGHIDQALTANEKALLLQPEHPGARNCRALWWLQTGDFEHGWPEYEWRWRIRGVSPRQLPQPLWDGSPLDGRTILVHAEQALGDTLQFLRYLPLVNERGGRVVMECQAPLEALLRNCPGIDQLIVRGSSLPECDVQAPLLSLPAIFGTSCSTIPASVPYLFADHELIDRWRRELHGSDFKIGIAWQGNPGFPGDRLRSIPLAQFAPLARASGARFFALQQGTGREQLRGLTSSFPVTDLGPRLDAGGAFIDTAAVMKCLDLVVTSDTAIAHLAGALGVPVWVALSIGPDWRWMINREDCPWYPTMRLFRQRRLYDWGEVFERMAVELCYGQQRCGKSVAIPVAIGELIDKITILEIKAERLTDAARLRNVRTELAALRECRDRELPPSSRLTELTAQLRVVNEALWRIEDDIRICEHNREFGSRFIELARSVYRNNDRRAAIKRQINDLVGSEFIEEKMYARYEGAPEA